MGFIGSCFEKLEGWLGNFSIEVFGTVLKEEWIQEALRATGRQTKRTRKLTAPFMVWLMIGLGLYRNLSIQNMVNRLGNILGVGSLWEGGEAPAFSSVVEARDRLGCGPLRYLIDTFRAWVLQKYQQAMSWKGLLVLALDGSTFKVPDSDENRRRFGLPRASRGRAAFPQMRAVFLVSTKLHFVLDALFAPYRRGEMAPALRMLGSIPKDSLVLLDRYFGSWQLLWGIRQRGGHFLPRLRKSTMRGKRIARLGRGDYLVEMKIHRGARAQCPALPKKILVREITARIGSTWYRFLTSVLDSSAYPAAELVKLYHERWEEELVLDTIKTHRCQATTVNRPVIFRSTRSGRVLQEAYGLVLAYNLIRALMTEAAQRRNLPPLRISFVDSLERIRSAALLMAAAPAGMLTTIFDDLMESIARCILPPRRDRKFPRAVCVKMSKYPLKKKSRLA